MFKSIKNKFWFLEALMKTMLTKVIRVFFLILKKNPFYCNLREQMKSLSTQLWALMKRHCLIRMDIGIIRLLFMKDHFIVYKMCLVKLKRMLCILIEEEFLNLIQCLGMF